MSVNDLPRARWSASIEMILHTESEKSPFFAASRNQPGSLSELHGLGAPLCAELIK